MKIDDIGVWLINLPADVGRRSAMEHQLTRLGRAVFAHRSRPACTECQEAPAL